MKRLFIAINPPYEIKNELEKLVNNLKISANQRFDGSHRIIGILQLLFWAISRTRPSRSL